MVSMTKEASELHLRPATVFQRLNEQNGIKSCSLISQQVQTHTTEIGNFSEQQ